MVIIPGSDMAFYIVHEFVPLCTSTRTGPCVISTFSQEVVANVLCNVGPLDSDQLVTETLLATMFSLDSASQTSVDSIVGIIPTTEVQWASNDVDHFRPASAPLLPMTSTTSNQNASSTRTLVITDAPSTTRAHRTTLSPATIQPKRPEEFSSHADVGIGVGVSITGLALLAVGARLSFRRRRSRRQKAQTFVDSKAELIGEDKRIDALLELVLDGATHEVDGQRSLVEFSNNTQYTRPRVGVPRTWGRGGH